MTERLADGTLRLVAKLLDQRKGEVLEHTDHQGGIDRSRHSVGVVLRLLRASVGAVFGVLGSAWGRDGV